MSVLALLLMAALPGGGEMPEVFKGTYVDWASSCRVVPGNTLVIRDDSLQMSGKEYRLIMVEQTKPENLHVFVLESGRPPKDVRELHVFRDPAYNGNIVLADDLTLAKAAAEHSPPPADVNIIGAFERCPQVKTEPAAPHAQNR